MGKYYKDSLKGLLTRRLLVLVLLMIGFMSLAAMFISFYFLDVYKQQTTLWSLNLGNINSQNRLKSKSFEFGNGLQSMITDLQSYKLVTNNSFDGSLKLSRSIQQRDSYYLQNEIYDDINFKDLLVGNENG